MRELSPQVENIGTATTGPQLKAPVAYRSRHAISKFLVFLFFIHLAASKTDLLKSICFWRATLIYAEWHSSSKH